MNDAELRDLFASEEMKAALRQRIIDGTAKKHEIDLARTVGIAITEEEQAREYMRQMNAPARAMLLDLCAVSQTKAAPTLRLVRAGAWIGVVMPTDVDANRLRMTPSDYDPPIPNNTEPETAAPQTVAPSDETDDILPRKPTKS